MKRTTTIVGLFALAVFAACTSSPSTPNLKSSQPAISAKKSQVLGMIEVEISSQNGAISSAKFVQPNGLQAKGTTVPIKNRNFVLTPGTTTYMTDATHKYFQNTLSFENKTGVSFSNLAMYPVNLPASVGGTAFTAVSTLTNVALTGTAASDLARATLPTHGMSSITTVNPAKADMMLYMPDEAATVQTQLTVAPFSYVNPTVLEYGFLGRNQVTAAGRAIGTSAAACTSNGVTCSKGTVTWAFKFPLSLPNSSNLGKFSFRYVLVNELGSFGIQSLEEQTTTNSIAGGGISAFNEVRTLAGSYAHWVDPQLNPLCRVRTAVPFGAVATSAYLGPDPIPNASGSLDVCFGLDGRVITSTSPTADQANSVAIQADGKIVAAGQARNTNSYNDFAVVRLNPNGSRDNSFGNHGLVLTAVSPFDDVAHAIAIQSDGKIVVAGSKKNGNETDIAVVRYNIDGSLDASFDGDSTMPTAYPGNGVVTTAIGSSYDSALALSVQNDGKIVVAGPYFNGFDSDFALVRYNTDGSLDTSFDGDTTMPGYPGNGKITTAIGPSHDVLFAMAIQVDGKIVAAGYNNDFGYQDGHEDFVLVRYNTNGSLDTSFDGDSTMPTAYPGNGIVTTDFSSYTDTIYSITIQLDGKIVAAGFSENGSKKSFSLARYNTEGSLDNSFGANGKVVTNLANMGFTNSLNEEANAVTLQPDGKILIAGYSATSPSPTSFFTLVRYLPNGSLDTSFNSTGIVRKNIGYASQSNTAKAIALQSDGKIVVSGIADFPRQTSSPLDFGLARFNP
jgi:uncharacterized delta-60 repeat protein